MSTLRYLTAGESHGRQLTAILEGCPSRLEVAAADIDAELARRQLGFGRGERQTIEHDRAQILSGVRYGLTTGAPITVVVENRDAANWGDVLAVEKPATPAEPVRVPRPGHADLGGALLYDLPDLRDVIERASARETAARVACGALARRLLRMLGCTVHSHVLEIGGVKAANAPLDDLAGVDADPLRCLDRDASAAMQAAVVAAGKRGDTLGGVFEVLVLGYPAGVGSYVEADRRLGARLASAVMSVPAVKGVELGLGFAASRLAGSQVHDPIAFDEERGYYRETNRAGGVEGGMSTGEPIVVRAAMKPIATLRTPLRSVHMDTHSAVDSRFERSDVCAVPAAAVVGEAVLALTLAAAALERFGGATVEEFVTTVEAARRRARRL
jgi:chorismate synthase